MAMHRIPLIGLATLSACSVPQSAEPSLAPRAAESVDPRVPIPGDVVVGPADPALVARIAELLAEVRAGDATFRSVVANAEALAAAAGPAQSESWIVAQEALSGLVATRAPVTKAIADLDALAATRIAASGGILPGDLAAIEAATAEAGAIGQRQADLIDRLQARLAA
jgi:hypothetical protein